MRAGAVLGVDALPAPWGMGGDCREVPCGAEGTVEMGVDIER